jgi:hypothetical protein
MGAQKGFRGSRTRSPVYRAENKEKEKIVKNLAILVRATRYNNIMKNFDG